LLTAIGLNPALAGEGIFYAKQALTAYANAKAFKNVPQTVLDIVDIAIVEAKIGSDITKNIKRTNDLTTNAAQGVANLIDSKNAKNFKNYERLRKLRKVMQNIIGSKTWKLFGELSRWKKTTKNISLKQLRKALGTKKFRGRVKAKWKSTGIGKTWKNLKASLKTKFIGGLEKVGIKFTGKSVGKFLSKFTFGALDVGLGIWDIVDGIKAIKEGNAQAKEFRKAGKKVLGWKEDLQDLFGKIEKRCDDSAQKVSCEFTEWSSWGACKYLDSSPGHIEKGLTCGDSVQKRSRSMTFQDGEAQDAFLCMQDEDCQTKTGLDEIKPCGTSDANRICGSGWLRIITPNTCLPNGWYKRKESEPKADGTFEYQQIVSDSTVATWKKHRDQEQDRHTLFWYPEGPTWYMGKILESDSGRQVLYKAKADSDSTCPIGNDIPWLVKKTTNGQEGKQERDKDFQLTCLGDRSECCP